MKKGVLLAAAAAIALAGVDRLALAQVSSSRTETKEIGRYQLVRVSEMRIFLIDTATGQCWSRTPDADWRDEGNPTRTADRKRSRQGDRPAASLDLPEESVEMIVVQREERSIPGSDGSVRIRLGDITEGQVLMSVVTDEEDYLLETTSVSQGDTVQFSVGRQKYAAHIEELRNVLIGDDFAKITVTQAPRESSSTARPTPDQDR
ncbi:MAG: hypothetical protein HY000_36625 [Planctomycetes bacterium]|nr:hypothetical protein [Planctomycetota bacterium]